ncbi:hypothetical protein ACJ5H2_05280 [Nocardioides sp. R1-1]|uniref:hypothetical protein n=1 Tax=Nocardioides sp. R1-1 TaxID=3383502 RepID=UPI0038D1845E
MNHDELWISDIPRHGVVRTVVREGPHAARFDDLNGDGREVELTVFVRAADGWVPIAGHDDANYPDLGESAIRGWSDDSVWAVGRADPGSEITVEVDDQSHMFRADADGWWLAVVEVGDIDSLDVWDSSRVRIKYA